MINVKRIFLNIGMTLAVIAAVFLAHQLYENSFLIKTDGIIVSIEPSKNGYYVDENGGRENMMSYCVEYTAKDGAFYTDEIIGRNGEYEVGGTVRVFYDKRWPTHISYRTDNSFFIAIFGIPAVIMIFLCRSAFKGYKTEYLDRYRKTVIFSVITGWIPIIYFIWYNFFFTPTGYFFPGLGEALICILLFIAVPIINIIVWIISAAVYCKKQKKKGSVDKNGSA